MTTMQAITPTKIRTRAAATEVAHQMPTPVQAAGVLPWLSSCAFSDIGSPGLTLDVRRSSAPARDGVKLPLTQSDPRPGRGRSTRHFHRPRVPSPAHRIDAARWRRGGPGADGDATRRERRQQREHGGRPRPGGRPAVDAGPDREDAGHQGEQRKQRGEKRSAHVRARAAVHLPRPGPPGPPAGRPERRPCRPGRSARRGR